MAIEQEQQLQRGLALSEQRANAAQTLWLAGHVHEAFRLCLESLRTSIDAAPKGVPEAIVSRGLTLLDECRDLPSSAEDVSPALARRFDEMIATRAKLADSIVRRRASAAANRRRRVGRWAKRLAGLLVVGLLIWLWRWSALSPP